jgi:hypothetical protein
MHQKKKITSKQCDLIGVKLGFVHELLQVCAKGKGVA